MTHPHAAHYPRTMLRQLTKAVCDSSVVARESYLLWRPAVQGSFACQVVGPGSPPRWLQRGGLATSAGDSAEKSETKAPESAEVETSSSADEGSTSAAELQVPPPPPAVASLPVLLASLPVLHIKSAMPPGISALLTNGSRYTHRGYPVLWSLLEPGCLQSGCRAVPLAKHPALAHTLPLRAT